MLKVWSERPILRDCLPLLENVAEPIGPGSATPDDFLAAWPEARLRTCRRDALRCRGDGPGPGPAGDLAHGHRVRERRPRGRHRARDRRDVHAGRAHDRDSRACGGSDVRRGQGPEESVGRAGQRPPAGLLRPPFRVRDPRVASGTRRPGAHRIACVAHAEGRRRPRHGVRSVRRQGQGGRISESPSPTPSKPCWPNPTSCPCTCR